MMGMGGMGMGSMMGMGGMGMNHNRRPGATNEFHNIVQGFNGTMQLMYAGAGLVSFGKIFGGMLVEMIKKGSAFIYNTTKSVLKALLFNRVSYKILDGFWKDSFKLKSKSDYIGLVLKALGLIAATGLCLLFF
jgi:hypothetical protein